MKGGTGLRFFSFFSTDRRDSWRFQFVDDRFSCSSSGIVKFFAGRFLFPPFSIDGIERRQEKGLSLFSFAESHGYSSIRQE